MLWLLPVSAIYFLTCFLLLSFQLPQRVYLIKILRAGIPASLQSSFIAIGNMSVQRLINGFGTSVNAAYAAVTKIDMLSLTIIVGIAHALSVFTGQNMGASKIDRITTGLRQTLLFMLLLCSLLAVLIFSLRHLLLKLFINAETNPLSISIGASYLSIIGIAYIFAGIMRTYLGLLRGAGDVNVCFAAGLIELSTRVLLSYILVIPFSIIGAWIAVPVFCGVEISQFCSISSETPAVHREFPLSCHQHSTRPRLQKDYEQTGNSR